MPSPYSRERAVDYATLSALAGCSVLDGMPDGITLAVGEPDDQPTRSGVFTGPGEYEVTAFLRDGPDLTMGELGP